MSAKPAPFARARVDSLLARMFSVCALLLSVDLVSNGLSQAKYLDPFWFWSTFVALLAAQLGTLLGAFVFGNAVVWYRALVIVTLLTMLTWPMQVRDVSLLPESFTPWIWWAVGFSSLAAVGAFSTRVAGILLVYIPANWLLLHVSPAGGNSGWKGAIEDSLYSFFFATAMALLVIVLRNRVDQVDSAHQAQIAAVVRTAAFDAVERERVRINSIAHDKVLSTLALAAIAEEPAKRANAAKSASDAIQRLEREASRVPDGEAPVSTETFFEALGGMVATQAVGFDYRIKQNHLRLVPFDQAVAIAEATIQAAINSLNHSSADKRTITVSSTSTRLKIVVTDNGVGFRYSDLQRSNIGVRVAIRKRLEAFGVNVDLDTEKGTTWVFEVKSNA